jgi:hypothetical protein
MRTPHSKKRAARITTTLGQLPSFISEQVWGKNSQPLASQSPVLALARREMPIAARKQRVKILEGVGGVSVGMVGSGCRRLILVEVK